FGEKRRPAEAQEQAQTCDAEDHKGSNLRKEMTAQHVEAALRVERRVGCLVHMNATRDAIEKKLGCTTDSDKQQEKHKYGDRPAVLYPRHRRLPGFLEFAWYQRYRCHDRRRVIPNCVEPCRELIGGWTWHRLVGWSLLGACRDNVTNVGIIKEFGELVDLLLCRLGDGWLRGKAAVTARHDEKERTQNNEKS
ncbi:hypothetical protein AB4144_41810, partial [Rhizobiaceae sp. 2RAB30]